MCDAIVVMPQTAPAVKVEAVERWGAEVRLVRRSHVGGLIELEVRGCRVTVRDREAELLLVEDGGVRRSA